MELLQNFYETTLEALKDAKNDRLWFKTNTKLGKLYFDRNDFGKLQKILKQLHTSCQVSEGGHSTLNFECDAFGMYSFVQTDDGEDDLKKGTQLLEIYALEIQMYTVQKNNKKLKALYEQSLHIKSAIPHPLIMGVIRGKFLYIESFCMQTFTNNAHHITSLFGLSLNCHHLECGGKMHLREGEFEKAHTDFFEAFKNYDESGSARRTTCLKYLVLANM